MLILTIFILFIEALFFYIPIRHIKSINNLKDKIKLYIGIFLANIISTLIFNTSIFRYILYPILIFLTLKIINKNNRVYDFFIITFLMALKFIIEFIIAMIFYNNLVNLYVIFVIVMQTICISAAILLRKVINKIYKFIIKQWDYNKRFYLRYFVLISFNLFILFLIHNLIQIKEVF